MSRSVSWRRACPDQVIRRIDEALESRIYLLRETGPTGFLLKEDTLDTTFKVYLGDPHSCTCPVFKKEKELCIHIIWLFLRKFRLDKENHIIFQLGLVEREINEVIHGIHAKIKASSKRKLKTDKDGKNKLPAKKLDEDDVCPICQEDLLNKKELLTHCKYGCGNNVHIKCMKVWAQHQKTNGENIVKCPLCRTEFGSYPDIIREFDRLAARKKRIETSDIHIGAACKKCKLSPIQGKCYKCTICVNYHLCHTCFISQVHVEHSFHFRQRTSHRWRPATSRISQQISPLAVVNSLQNKEITESLSNLLPELNRSKESGSIVENLLNTIPMVVLRQDTDVIKRKDQCQICCQQFLVHDCVRVCPCSHLFHRQCIDDWLLDDHVTCPLDGHKLISNTDTDNNSRTKKPSPADKNNLNCASPSGVELAISGSSALSLGPVRINSKRGRMRGRLLSRAHSNTSIKDVDMAISGLGLLEISPSRASCSGENIIRNEISVSSRSAAISKNNSFIGISNILSFEQTSHLSDSSLPPIPPATRYHSSRSGVGLHHIKNQISDLERRYSNDDSSSNITQFKPMERRVISSAENGIHRGRGKLIHKRLSSTLCPATSSEPNLSILSDSVHVNGISAKCGEPKLSNSRNLIDC